MPCGDHQSHQTSPYFASSFRIQTRALQTTTDRKLPRARTDQPVTTNPAIFLLYSSQLCVIFQNRITRIDIIIMDVCIPYHWQLDTEQKPKTALDRGVPKHSRKTWKKCHASLSSNCLSVCLLLCKEARMPKLCTLFYPVLASANI